MASVHYVEARRNLERKKKKRLSEIERTEWDELTGYNIEIIVNSTRREQYFLRQERSLSGTPNDSGMIEGCIGTLQQQAKAMMRHIRRYLTVSVMTIPVVFCSC